MYGINASVVDEPEREATPFGVDTDALRELASEAVVQRGTRYFQENRVFELTWTASELHALVEGSRPAEPYRVSIARADEGELVVDCSCPYDWEPVCKHAIATFLAYTARQRISDKEIAGAAAEALEERIRSGRTAVVVNHVAGRPDLGEWSARSVNPTGSLPRAYKVRIRSATERLNHCECPDFAFNQLGTCKHIEAVLHKLRKRKKGARSDAPEVPVVYLAWDCPAPPRIRLRRSSRQSPALDGVLDAHFDGEGFLRGELPVALQAFQRAARRFPEVVIGEDAIGHAEDLGAQASARERARRVERTIRHSSGRIDGLRARLLPYQVEGVAFLAATGRALLADDMGLGKTVQAIAASVWMRRHEGVERTLVVCPASLKHQWAREIARFTDLDVEVIQGAAPARRAQYRRKAAFSIVNYELVMRDHERIERLLAPDLLIVDEAQRVKNWRTKTATAIKRLDTRFAFVLSGTPLENRLEDLYSVMQVVDQRGLGPLWRFMLDFHVTDERGKVIGYRNLSTLRQRLAPTMLRRDRRIVAAQLPPRIEHRLDVTMTSRQTEIHDSALYSAYTLARIARRRPLTPSEEHRLMAALQTARMACNAAGLVDDETEGSPKLAELGRVLEELCVEGGLKVVVFSQWKKMTAMAAQVAEGLGLGVLCLHGGIPTAKRGALIERFETDPAVQVFLCTDAGGVGLNLQAAGALVNLDLPWNPAVLDQRIARVHRLGQRRSVQIVVMVAAGSYEQRVEAMLSRKRELFANVVSGDDEQDVLGLSKRLLQEVMEDLAAGSDDEDLDAVPAGDHPLAVDDTPLEEPTTGSSRPECPPAQPDDPRVGQVVQRLQSSLGARLEQVLVTAGGLVAIATHVDAASHALAEELSQELPVAVVDRATWAGLCRLRAMDEDARTCWEPAPSRAAAEPALIAGARRKLAAAEVLLASGCTGEAVRLLADAILMTLAHRAGRDDAPNASESALWLYGQAVPSGAVSPEDAARAVRADALARAGEVPSSLADEVLADARGLLQPTAAVEPLLALPAHEAAPTSPSAR